MGIQLPLPGVAWPCNISARDPAVELERIEHEKVQAKYEIRQVLDKYADRHGISHRLLNQLVWGYVDDMLGDMFFDLEEELKRERDDASDIC